MAVTCSAWCSRWKVWMPQPVPRSRALATCRRAVTCTRVVDAWPIPSTWSWRRTPARWCAARSLATQRSAPPPRRPSHRVPAVGPQVHLGLHQPGADGPSGHGSRAPVPAARRCGPREGGVERLRASAAPRGARAVRRRRAPPSSGSPEGAPVTISAGMSWSRLEGGMRGLAEQLRHPVDRVAKPRRSAARASSSAGRSLRGASGMLPSMKCVESVTGQV